MMDIDPPEFLSKDDEIQYWMELAHQIHRRKEDLERELEEFQENSQLLEKELEASLEQAEKTNRELRQRNTRLATEVEQLRTRLDQQSTDCAMFQGKAQDLQTQHDHLLKYIRELEQKNDDLERAHRINRVTEEEIEAKLNSAIEKNALLESELDEKEALKVIVQRLMDEIRDLKQEIQVQERHQPDNDKSADRVRNHVDSNKLQVELETHSAPIVPQSITPSNTATSPLKIGNRVVGGVTGNNNNNNNVNPPLAPCTRILAMNMIGDLMRKVGLDRWVCMDCKKVKCTCVGGKNTVSTTPTDLPSVQVHTPAQCIRQQPRSTKC
ncbi:nuclear distribution protein nudE-like 1-A isoform X1 [Osmia bicornis bicornis]|uniref:nuclear distribution protein nudE-like 1-A isoform X1 n=1 Tax=Osmia bicornis bicornis TaxID=1437191 RepID=UPI0010F704F8|nr:nuclear distribution protein nudE-like 1-A isoform X1 [Osmia bicornis bicornis]XP_046143574.1 nuclear distribution protein nudE-like 1-A isoform X1 [Osmia bicornis bicornis]XP_046143575.1 nuclear distribution protein nudE-like 1-A isoform X1 [Osmia bicornis bicornis]XP_046143576.1 nuclear distribution protein nudE-like 1-A isoform X1 [Osmia bicornis bicornis]XP_046143577.1 nuclear distribution protein nudE-like 1-A isoform X1 [Osmia bicornis bicornis]XP_046143578.1 nuclear distribution prot